MLYTHFRFKGTVKPEYRQSLELLYKYRPRFRKSGEPFYYSLYRFKIKPLFKFSNGKRAEEIFCGWGGSPWHNSYNAKTGLWEIDCVIKDLLEDSWSKKTSEYFIEAIPNIFEDGMTYSEHYDEFSVPTKYVLKHGVFKCTNSRKIKKAIKKKTYFRR